MTKTSMTLLTLACALALSACGGKPEGGHAAAGEAKASSAGLPDGNADAGREFAAKGGEGIAPCASCHGADGNAPIDGMYPKLGGQYADYLAQSLQGYRNGTRAGATADVMAAQAKNLSDQQIADLAAYYASVPGSLRDLQNAN